VDGNTTAFKTANYVSNVLTELGISTSGRPADMLTKPGNLQQHMKFTRSIQGLDLLPDDYFKMYALTATGHEDEENNH